MKEIDSQSNPARALFERAVRGLDPATSNRLRLARRAALAGDPPRPWSFAPAWVATGGFSFALVLALGLAWWRPAPEAVAPPAAGAAVVDEAVLVAEESEEEIYAWLAEAPVAAEAEPEQAL